MGLAWSDQDLKNFVQERLLFYLAPDDKEVRDSIWRVLQEQISATAFQFKIGVNILAAIGLVTSAAALLMNAERQFNRLWDVSVTRGYFSKLRIFWLILTTSPLAIGGSIYFDQLTSTGTVIGNLKSQYTTVDILYSFLIPSIVSFIAFTILNVLLPNTRVKVRNAAVGAVVSAILWEAAKKGFYVYVNQAHKYGKFYGSLGILPVFLVWIYITWVIILVGAEIVVAAQHLRQFTRSMRGSGKFQPASPYLGIYFLDRIYGAFEAGRPLPGLEQIADEVDVAPEHLEPIARRLMSEGILIEDKKRPGTFAPARAPSLVKLRELVEVLPESLLQIDDLEVRDGQKVVSQRVFQLFRGARSAFLDSFGDRTMEDLQGEAHGRGTAASMN